MRKITHYILYILITCTALLNIQCSGNGKEKTPLPELVHAESVMFDYPDSALHILGHMPMPSARRDKENHALWCLLVTQAQYKQALKIPSDSLVRIAYDYYKPTKNARRKAMSALYMGGVNYNLGNIEESIRLGAFTISLCLNGHITTDINMIRYDVQPGDMVITLPKDIIEHKDVSSDIRGIFFIVSQRFIEEAFPKIGEILPIFLYIQKYPKIELTANQCFNIQQFYDFFIQRLKDQSVYRDKMISSILQALIYYIAGLLINSDKREKKERKEELLSKFIQLIIKHYKENRTLDFYAEKLFISTKYMSDIIKKTSGLTAHDWIDRYTILEAKILLRSTNKTIQEISNELNFPNHSFFSKYFKHHMGMTPKAYRLSS